MRARARLELRFHDARTAGAVAASVRLDDEGYIRTHRKGSVLTAEASAESPMSLLHTLDDYLACVSVAERTTEAARPQRSTKKHRTGPPRQSHGEKAI